VNANVKLMVLNVNLKIKLDTTISDKVCQWFATGRWFSSGTPVSPTNKTDHHDITEILLKVALNTINLNPNLKLPLIGILSVKASFKFQVTDLYLFTTLFPNGVLLRHIKSVKGQ
jgi:hypothetical protein